MRACTSAASPTASSAGGTASWWAASTACRCRAAFFGESMFSRARDASKVALVHLVARLIAGGYRLLDAQFMTEHLTQFGAQEISRTRLSPRGWRRRWRPTATFQRLAAIGGAAALQVISQAS